MNKIKTQLLILFLFLVSASNLFSETLEMNLATFATYVSETNNVNILIDDDLKNQNIIFIVNDQESYFLEAFKKAVNFKGLDLIKTDKFYFVTKKDIYVEEFKYRAIKLNFVKFEDIANFLKVYDSIKYEFITTSKTLMIYSKQKEFDSINQMINAIDTVPKKLKLKVSILDTNLEKLKELGSDTSILNFQNSDSNFFINLVSYPFSVKNDVTSAKKDSFYTFLKFLDSSGTSEFLSYPVLTLTDEKQTIFDVVSNVPYQMGSTTINDTALRTSNQYEYKDVGLQINVLPHIYSDDNVYLDLDLNVSNIQSNTDNLPVTNKKYIKQSFHLKVNNLLVLTGLNKKELITTHNEVPVLADIPYLGWLFKYDSTQLNKTNLTVVFELIDEEQYTNNDLIVVVPNKLKE